MFLSLGHRFRYVTVSLGNSRVKLNTYIHINTQAPFLAKRQQKLLRKATRGISGPWKLVVGDVGVYKVGRSEADQRFFSPLQSNSRFQCLELDRLLLFHYFSCQTWIYLFFFFFFFPLFNYYKYFPFIWLPSAKRAKEIDTDTDTESKITRVESV